MTLADLTTGQKWAIAATFAAGLGGSVWGYSRWRSGDESKVAVPKELTVEGMKAAALDPGTAMDNFRSIDREGLTDEQRRQVRENMRTVFEDAMNERVTEYFTAPDEEKTAILDEHLDEMDAWRKAFEERRKEMEAEREKDKEKEGEREARGPMGPQTREERKDRSESRNPDQTAQRMAYFMALRSRASERGISMPWGGRGGMGGGPGGPPGGGGRRGP